jgi:hypothetical protein
MDEFSSRSRSHSISSCDNTFISRRTQRSGLESADEYEVSETLTRLSGADRIVDRGDPAADRAIKTRAVAVGWAAFYKRVAD